MKTIVVMKRALAALEYHTEQTRPIQHSIEAIAALREAISSEETQPMAVPSSEREALIKRLRKLPSIIYTTSYLDALANQAADMLAADAQRQAGDAISIECYQKQVDDLAASAQPVSEAVPLPPFGSKRNAAMAIYQPPFKFQHGYIHDSNNHMVADQGGFGDKNTVAGAVALQIRGWGRIGYMPNAAELQDEIGAMVVDALNAYYTAPPAPSAKPLTDEQIELLLDEALIKAKTVAGNGPYYKLLARAIEAAHNITGEPT